MTSASQWKFTLHTSRTGWLELAEAGENRFNRVVVYMVSKGIALLSAHFCFGLQQGRLCNSDSSGLKLSVKVTNPCSKFLCTEVRGTFKKQTLCV